MEVGRSPAAMSGLPGRTSDAAPTAGVPVARTRLGGAAVRGENAVFESRRIEHVIDPYSPNGGHNAGAALAGEGEGVIGSETGLLGERFAQLASRTEKAAPDRGWENAEGFGGLLDRELLQRTQHEYGAVRIR